MGPVKLLPQVLLSPQEVDIPLKHPPRLSRQLWLDIQARIGPATPQPLYDLSSRVNELLYRTRDEEDAP
jgi:hypothetical protein